MFALAGITSRGVLRWARPAGVTSATAPATTATPTATRRPIWNRLIALLEVRPPSWSRDRSRLSATGTLHETGGRVIFLGRWPRLGGSGFRIRGARRGLREGVPDDRRPGGADLVETPDRAAVVRPLDELGLLPRLPRDPEHCVGEGV